MRRLIAFLLVFLAFASCATAPRPQDRVATVVMSVGSYRLVLGGAPVALFAYALPTSAGNKSITWSTSDPSVALVDAEGLVTAVAPGQAVIVASADGKSATCSISVEKPSAEVSIDKIEQYFYSSLALYDTFVTVYFTITNTGKLPILSDAVALVALCADGSSFKGVGRGNDIGAGVSLQFKAFIDVGAKQAMKVTVVDQTIAYR